MGVLTLDNLPRSMSHAIQDAIDQVNNAGRTSHVECLQGIDGIRAQIKEKKGCGLFKKDKWPTIVSLFNQTKDMKNRQLLHFVDRKPDLSIFLF
jgi:hypothetical protein